MELPAQTHSDELRRRPAAPLPGNRPGPCRTALLLRTVALVCALTFGRLRDGQATDLTWNGGGADVNWQTAANWGGTAPATSDALFFAGTVSLTPNNDFTTQKSFKGVTFDSEAGAFTLVGYAIRLSGGITNNSASLQTISLGLYLSGNRTINAASGDLIITSVISQTGGTYGFTKLGSGTLILSGVNTYGGGTTINAGTLAISTDNNLGATSGALSLSGGTLSNSVDVALNLARSVSLDSGGGTFATASGTTLTLGQVIGGSGGLTKSGGGTLTLNQANTYAGGTTLRAGVLQLGTVNAIPSTGTFTFAGGVLDANNKSDAMGLLSLTANSTILFHADNTQGTLTFSSGSRTAGTLTIDNWSGTSGNGGTDDRIVIGSSATLDSAFLANVMWTRINGGGTSASGALQLGDGTLTPAPEFSPVYAAGLLLVIFAWAEHHRLGQLLSRNRLWQAVLDRLRRRRFFHSASAVPGRRGAS